jgi:hypothetical protein
MRTSILRSLCDVDLGADAGPIGADICDVVPQDESDEAKSLCHDSTKLSKWGEDTEPR